MFKISVATFYDQEIKLVILVSTMDHKIGTGPWKMLIRNILSSKD